MFRVLFFLISSAVLLAALALPGSAGLFPTVLAVWLVGNLLGTQRHRERLCVTLTVSEIMADVLEAFKTRVPGLNYFATDFGSEEAKYGQTIIAHLPTIPTVYDHVASTGYNANAQSARSLLTDVPIVMNGWKDVQIKIQLADATQDRSKNYLKTIGNAGYALGKAVVDFALTKALAANFSNVTTESIANTTSDTLGAVRKGMNGVKAGNPRFMLCNSDFFSALDNDPRITSGDYYGQRTGAEPFGKLISCKGFSEIAEYPDFPANAENLSALAFDSRAIGIATRLPNDATELAAQMGIPIGYKKETITDPGSGLSLVGFSYIDNNTHYIYTAVSVMFGAVAGSQGGSAGDLLDYAGWRVRTAA